MPIHATWAQPVLVTARELLALPEDEWRYELVEGRLVRMTPTGDRHNRTSARLFVAVYAFVAPRGLGEVYPQESGFLVSASGDPDTVLAPDLAFVARDRVPQPSVEGFPRVVPDLVAEVISPSQTLPQLRQKADTWLAYGVKNAWILVPETHSVEVWSAGRPPIVLGEADILAGEDVLAGFEVRVADLFPL
ncbi:MAG TPA: Uma2 family endonuclease [Chloroflexota bacterium]|nr:Uma2 family endonuclease [Chloroflexota bacterium]